jgi:glycosyltransferase involved in cell wall biosynthesis
MDRSDLPYLVVAGRPAWNAAGSMAALNRSGRVHWAGFVSEPDKVALLRGCLAFVFPSLYEGFGFPVLEAMACGAPVICTNAGALADLAGPAWRREGNGRALIRAGSEAALGDQHWLEAARRDGPSWTARFTWAASARQHLEVYRLAISRHGRSRHTGGGGESNWT